MKLKALIAAIDRAPGVYIKTSGYGMIEFKKPSLKEALYRKWGREDVETSMCLDRYGACAPDPTVQTTAQDRGTEVGFNEILPSGTHRKRNRRHP